MSERTAVRPHRATHPAPPDRRPGHFRVDVEGLRAVAIGLVLLYHAGLPFVPAGYVGVDVFFVISGFLITTQLVSELDRTGTVSLPRFYARRAKRLLPAAAMVLATTVVLVRLYVPRTRWEEIGGDIIGSALYVVNWRLADRSVDYLAEDSVASPVQHFWSLAVEEQFYLAWPLLILVSALVARALRGRARPVLWLGLAAVAVPSFAWALAETARAPERAFFVTTTRMWELAIGAAVALGAGLFTRLPGRWAAPLGWTGLAAVAASGLVFTTGTPWPGYAAALPTLGTAAVIAAGFAATRAGPAALLGTAPFQAVGALSYSLYLWHWPLLAVAAAHWGGLSAGQGLAVAAGSAIPAWLTYRLVENPVRHSAAVSRSPRLALSLGANFTLAGVVAGLALLLSVSVAIPDRGAGGPAAQPALGAAALGGQPRGHPAGAPVDSVEWMVPDPLQATEDVPDLYAEGCQQSFEAAEVLACEYGDPRAEITVAVVGDSKIAQWLPAVQLIAEQSGWHVVTYTKSQCSFTAATIDANGRPYTSCVVWNEQVLNRLLTDPPELLLTSQRKAQAYAADGELSVDAMVAGLRSHWSAITAAGTTIAVIADTPGPPAPVYECVEANRTRLTVCGFERERYETSAAPTQRLAAAGQTNVYLIDLFDAICPGEQCVPVIGNVLIYRQGSHITATYVETLAPQLAAALSRAGIPAAYAGPAG
jgi:peptidoglycan/LPS O-acetylase OafA/YrhL